MASVRSEKGRQRFVDGNYIFWADGRSKVSPDLRFWKCSQKPVCKARLHTIDNQVVHRIHEHTHVNDGRKVQTAQVIDRIHEEASNSRENPETLIGNCGWLR